MNISKNIKLQDHYIYELDDTGTKLRVWLPDSGNVFMEHGLEIKLFSCGVKDGEIKYWDHPSAKRKPQFVIETPGHICSYMPVEDMGYYLDVIFHLAKGPIKPVPFAILWWREKMIGISPYSFVLAQNTLRKEVVEIKNSGMKKLMDKPNQYVRMYSNTFQVPDEYYHSKEWVPVHCENYFQGDIKQKYVAPEKWEQVDSSPRGWYLHSKLRIGQGWLYTIATLILVIVLSIVLHLTKEFINS